MELRQYSSMRFFSFRNLSVSRHLPASGEPSALGSREKPTDKRRRYCERNVNMAKIASRAIAHSRIPRTNRAPRHRRRVRSSPVRLSRGRREQRTSARKSVRFFQSGSDIAVVAPLGRAFFGSARTPSATLRSGRVRSTRPLFDGLRGSTSPE